MERKEAIGDTKWPVLDQGYVQYIEHWGSDERIVESARMSTQRGFDGWGPHRPTCVEPNTDGALECDCPKDYVGDEKLLKYLWTHKHGTPFEMCGLTIEVQAPIMVIREWHRHRTQGYSEASARYGPLPDINYLPRLDRVLINANDGNKQAGAIAGAGELTLPIASEWLDQLDIFYKNTETFYQTALMDGIPKELARLCLPVGRYSRMRATGNLRNWLHFESLRLDKNAQWEIRQYAEMVGILLKQLFPRTWDLFTTTKS